MNLVRDGGFGLGLDAVCDGLGGVQGSKAFRISGELCEGRLFRVGARFENIVIPTRPNPPQFLVLHDLGANLRIS